MNFAQYDYSGLPLNRSPLIRAAIPEEGTHAYRVMSRVLSRYSMPCRLQVPDRARQNYDRACADTVPMILHC